MEKVGFRLSASCAGKASYTKFTSYKGKRAYVTVTDPSGEGFPNSMTDPVRVTIFDFRSGDELEDGRDFDSLSAYLESTGESPPAV